jgi:hypothetical protein
MDYVKLYGNDTLTENAREQKEFYEQATQEALADDELVLRYEVTNDPKKPRYKEPSAIAKYGLDRMGVVLDPEGATYVAYNPMEYSPRTELMQIDKAQVRQFLRDLVDTV